MMWANRRDAPGGIIAPDFTMADPVYWDDPYPIALLLNEAHPEVDPIGVPHAMLRDWVIGLDGFSDDRQALPMECLERIQMEWVELKQDG
jgi:FeS assembly protein IscX